MIQIIHELCKIPDHDIDTLTVKKSMKMKFLCEKIYCNSSPNDPHNTTMYIKCLIMTDKT